MTPLTERARMAVALNAGAALVSQLTLSALRPSRVASTVSPMTATPNASDSTRVTPSPAIAPCMAISGLLTTKRALGRSEKVRLPALNDQAGGERSPEKQNAGNCRKSSGVFGTPCRFRKAGDAHTTLRTAPTRIAVKEASARCAMRTATSSPSSIRSEC